MTYVNHPDQGLDLELLFCTSVLNLKSLHYGYWEDDDELTLDSLRKAQQRYTETLVDLIPEQVSTILDVGCGLGDISAALVGKGYKVTAISPDAIHHQHLENLLNENLVFYQIPFERLNTRQKHDLVLMSESQNYFDNNTGFRQAINHLHRGGYLLVSGTFKKKATELFERVISIEDVYLERAKRHGLELIKSIDITKHILPQSRFENKIYREHIESFIEIVKQRVESTMSFRLKLLKLFSRKTFKLISDIYEDRLQRADPELVEQNIKYIRLLFVYS